MENQDATVEFLCTVCGRQGLLARDGFPGEEGEIVCPRCGNSLWLSRSKEKISIHSAV